MVIPAGPETPASPSRLCAIQMRTASQVILDQVQVRAGAPAGKGLKGMDIPAKVK